MILKELLVLVLCTFLTVKAATYPAMNVYYSSDCTGTALFSEVVKATLIDTVTSIHVFYMSTAILTPITTA